MKTCKLMNNLMFMLIVFYLNTMNTLSSDRSFTFKYHPVTTACSKLLNHLMELQRKSFVPQYCPGFTLLLNSVLLMYGWTIYMPNEIHSWHSHGNTSFLDLSHLQIRHWEALLRGSPEDHISSRSTHTVGPLTGFWPNKIQETSTTIGFRIGGNWVFPYNKLGHILEQGRRQNKFLVSDSSFAVNEMTISRTD